MIIVGLIGQTGAGKSSVCQILEEQGVFVVDGDRVAREITQTGSPVLDALAESFGADILREDGSLNRALLASRAFASPENTQKLNAVTHPSITQRALRELAAAELRGFDAAVFEGAALLESPLRDCCHFFAAVTAPRALRLERILARDSISAEAAQLRMAAQQAEGYYTNAAAVILRNHPPYDLKEETKKLLCEMERRRAAEGAETGGG